MSKLICIFTAALLAACTATDMTADDVESRTAAVSVPDEGADLRPTVGSMCYQGCWHSSIDCSIGCGVIEDRAAEDRCDLQCTDQHLDCRGGCHVLFGDGLVAETETDADMQSTGCHLDCFRSLGLAEDRCDNRFFYIGRGAEWQACLQIAYDDREECDDWCRSYPFPTGQI